MRRTMLFVLLALLSLGLMVAPAFAAKKGKKKKKKKGEVEPPPVGEIFVGNIPCYAPPDFGALSEGKRRMERQSGFQSVNRLVTGVAVGKDGAPLTQYKIEDDDYDYFERAFLGRPQLLDDWLAENLQKCQDVGNSKMKEGDYFSYLRQIGRELESNECYRPLDYEWHDFLDIGQGWQRRVHTCKGDKVLIEGTNAENGQYTIADTGKMSENTFMTVEGDPSTPEAGEIGLVPELPLGALVMRFQSEDDSYTKYFQIGFSVEFEAPDHGFLSFAINDTTYYDNKFRDIKGAIDYLGVDIYPSESEDKVE